MTLAAPRSRQGRLLLVLAFLAATVAVVGTFVWASNAQADVPASPHTTVVVTDDNGGTANPGDLITYTVTIKTDQAATGTTTHATFELQADPNLWPVSFGDNGAGNGPWDASDCSIVGGALQNDIKCVDPVKPVDDDVITIVYKVIPFKDNTIVGPNDQPAPECEVYDDGPTTVAGAGVDCTYATGSLETTINDYTITPKTAANGPGQPHTVTIDLPAGFTCKSDPTPEDALRVCTPPDVAIANSAGATATLVGLPIVTGTNTFAPGTVAFTINSPTLGNVQMTLDLVFATGLGANTYPNGPFVYDLLVDPVAFKVYGVVAQGGTAVLRHVDLPDLGTEDASGSSQTPYCTTYLAGAQPGPNADPIFNGVCGVLPGQDDIDDAQGSFHGACIIGSLLTFAANNGAITWHIDGVPGPGPVAAGVSTFAGPNGEPCVMWSVGTPGTQQITAVYHEGLPDQVRFWWKANPNLPLIKEWNTIDSTRIVSTTGNLGDDPADVIAGNTGGADNWTARDCSTLPLVPANGGDCVSANLDSLTLPVEGSFILNSNTGSFIKADGSTFIDYTMGHHSDAGGAYTGPVDGAQQTYTISGDCGSIRIEDPATGNIDVIAVQEGTDADQILPDFLKILSSDKGVAFQFEPNDTGALSTTIGNGDCGAGATICVTIDTIEANLFHSPNLLQANQEHICVQYNIGPPTNKTPILAWAGQRVVLENYWGDSSLTNTPAEGPSHAACASNEVPNGGPVDSAALGSRGGTPAFGVQYSIQSAQGSFTGTLVGSAHDIDQTGRDAIVHVNTAPKDDNGDGITDPNSNCTSRIIVESQDQTEMDVTSYVVNDGDNVGNATPRSQQVSFVIYFMKFESEKLQLIPDNIPTTDVWDKGGTPTDGPVTTTVSDNVAAAVTVRGYVVTDNCPARPEKIATGKGDGQLNEYFPPNRCIFPDDWAFKAGALSQTTQCTNATPPAPQQCRPEMDIASTTAYTTLCPSDPRIAGPFSMLDQIVNAGLPVGCGDSLAPYPPDNAGASAGCLTGGLTYACRDSNFPDGIIDTTDAPMPPALVEFNLTGAGFLTGIGKAAAALDTGFASAAIPAEPWISQINNDGQGYVWNTWGAGSNSGLYQYWTSLAAHGPEVVSCAAKSAGKFVNPVNPSANPCTNDPAPIGLCQAPGAGSGCVRTGGYDMTEVYSDEHGLAVTLINGDANLDFSGCKTSAPVTGTTTQIVLLHGFYCAKGSAVGTSTLNSAVDYPDKRKHFAELTNPATINWTWNGTKDVTVVADPNDTTGQFHYVVFHVTDRDGFCGGDAAVGDLHPVLGEEVDFRIDSTSGIIFPDINGNSAEGPASLVSGDLKSAMTHTFDTAANPAITIAPVMVTGECQAWIHVSESQLKAVNVVVTAFDPEGTVTFDTQGINPTPAPTPVPTPVVTPTPAPTKQVTWGDWDCSGSIDIGDAVIDARKVVGLPFVAPAGCPTVGSTLSVTLAGHTQNRVWGDADCSGGATPIDIADAINIERAIVHLPITVFDSSCPGLGESVTIPA